MPELSVIIPVYNAAENISKCARSLFGQTCAGAEYIFVDDCSTDTSIAVLEEVLREYPDRKEQVRILRHDRNRGAAAARLTGIHAAQGGYLAFCDADDWTDSEMYGKMLSKAAKEDSDIVFCDYFNAFPSGEEELITTIRSDRDLLGEIVARNIPVSLCCRIFRRTLFSEDLTVPDIRMGEDFAMFVQLVHRSEKISYVPEALYHYYQHADSYTHSQNAEQVMNMFRSSVECTRFIISFLQGKGLSDRYRRQIVLLKHNMRNALLLDFNAANRRLWLSTFPEINFIIPFIREIPLRERVKYILKALYIDRRSNE